MESQMLPDTQPQVYGNAQLSTMCLVCLLLASLHPAQLHGYLFTFPLLSKSLWKASRDRKKEKAF